MHIKYEFLKSKIFGQKMVTYTSYHNPGHLYRITNFLQIHSPKQYVCMFDTYHSEELKEVQ